MRNYSSQKWKVSLKLNTVVLGPLPSFSEGMSGQGERKKEENISLLNEIDLHMKRDKERKYLFKRE